MKTSLFDFYRAYFKNEYNFNKFKEKNTFNFIVRPQEMPTELDYMFNNSTLRMLWRPSKIPQALEENILKYWKVPIEVHEDNEHGIWRYSFEYNKDFYFTIDSKERIIL